MSDSIIMGVHAVHAALQAKNKKITQLIVQQGRQDKRMQTILQLAKDCAIDCTVLPRKDMDKRFEQSRHQGVVAIVDSAREKHYQESDIWDCIASSKAPLLLILDGIQDPHNLGACLRSCDAAGVDAVIAPKDKSVGITPVVRKVACGAAESVPFIQVTNLARFMRQLQEHGVWIYGMAGEAQAFYYDTNFCGPTAIVMGAEQKGLRRLTREHCDGLVKIPMFGHVESLNVSVATGIVLFEVARQRRKSQL